MKYDFDKIIDRTGTGAIKYDMVRRGVPEDVISMWVADMEFETPPFVIDAMKARCDHGIFGYTEHDKKFMDTMSNWFERRFSWTFDPQWHVNTPGVVHAITTAIRTLTEENDAVIIQEPVYYPFRSSVESNNRKLCVNQLIFEDGKYRIDFADFENQIKENNVKLFILCSPHNPVGKVWEEDELRTMGEICLRNGVIVIADEIHADFIYKPHKHHIFLSLDKRFEDMTIMCTAPSKTFNLAGLQFSNIFIPNKDIRRKFMSEISRSGYEQVSVMGMTACQAAYENGDEWLEELIEYLKGNTEYIKAFLKENLSDVKVVQPEGTYLLWLDFSGLGLDDKTLDHMMLNEAGIWLDGGTMFGIGGSGFQRVNVACPRSTVEKAMDRLVKAFKK